MKTAEEGNLARGVKRTNTKLIGSNLTQGKLTPLLSLIKKTFFRKRSLGSLLLTLC